MRIIYIGTVEFSRRALEKLIEMNCNIVGVCTKKVSSFNSDFSDLSFICQKESIPYNIVENINAHDNVEWIRNKKPDIIFCFGWSNLINKKILNIPPMGVLGYHPAKLPQNRGRHPLIWALVLGLKSTASTFFFMTESADDGEILSQIDVEISDNDDASSLYDKITTIAIQQITNFIPLLENNSFKTTPQDNSKANEWRKRNKNDGKIDFRMGSKAIYNLVRALTKPYIGAHIEYQGKEIKVWKISIMGTKQKNLEYGKVLQNKNNTLIVTTYDGIIAIESHSFEKLPNIGEYL
jgi:methionyl-tRNA formyltransferase